MTPKKQYSLQEKLELLATYDDALAGNPDHVAVWLKIVDIEAETLADWRRLTESGELTSDGVVLQPEFPIDGSIFQLARLYRAHLTQVRPTAYAVDPGSAAAAVVYDSTGGWRLDFLARARSVLTAVANAAAEDPAAVIRTNGEIEPADAVAAVRAEWGVDRFPRFVWRADELDGEKASTLDKRLERWGERVARSPHAFAALRDWYRAEGERELVGSKPVAVQGQPSIPRLPAHARPEAPAWQAKPAVWPSHPGERAWLTEIASVRLGELPELGRLDDPERGLTRQMVILLRRTAEVFDEYVRTASGIASVKIYYQHHVVRLWQWYSMEDLRSPEERGAEVTVGEKDRRIVAAIAAMALHTAIRDWKPKALESTINRVLDVFLPFSTTRPEAQHRQRAVAHRAAKAKLPELQKAVTPQHPEFINGATSNVAKLFYESDLLRLAPGRIHAKKYLDARARITEHDLAVRNGRRVVQLADYSANLAVAPSAVRERLLPGQAELIRKALLRSTEGNAYASVIHRNAALGLQRRSFDGAISHGRRGVVELQRKHANGIKEDREMLIIEEQLRLNLAGSAVQWIEHLLAGDDRWQQSIDRRQWEQLTNFALYEATRAVEIIEQLYEEGELEGQRYEKGFLADGNFRFKAWDILYRCACAGATAAAAFGFEDPIKGYDFFADLDDIHFAVTTIDKPIVAGELPRLLHSMLWHTLLMGGVLPALQYEGLNASLIDKDPLTRVLSAEEQGDRRARLEMTYTRVALLTDWLIARGWSAGAVGTVAKGSRVWQVLEHRSGGLYSVWREDFGTLLDVQNMTTPPRKRYSFHEQIGYPGAG